VRRRTPVTAAALLRPAECRGEGSDGGEGGEVDEGGSGDEGDEGDEDGEEDKEDEGDISVKRRYVCWLRWEYYEAGRKQGKRWKSWWGDRVQKAQKERDRDDGNSLSLFLITYVISWAIM
jgi:hypothetical protein